jgi:hypothetical protein
MPKSVGFRGLKLNTVLTIRLAVTFVQTPPPKMMKSGCPTTRACIPETVNIAVTDSTPILEGNT